MSYVVGDTPLFVKNKKSREDSYKKISEINCEDYLSWNSGWNKITKINKRFSNEDIYRITTSKGVVDIEGQPNFTQNQIIEHSFPFYNENEYPLDMKISSTEASKLAPLYHGYTSSGYNVIVDSENDSDYVCLSVSRFRDLTRSDFKVTSIKCLGKTDDLVYNIEISDDKGFQAGLGEIILN